VAERASTETRVAAERRRLDAVAVHVARWSRRRAPAGEPVASTAGRDDLGRARRPRRRRRVQRGTAAGEALLATPAVVSRASTRDNGRRTRAARRSPADTRRRADARLP